jgi:hypothetical protein
VKKMGKGRSSKKQAIRKTLHRLGMQARAAEVVASLAAAGISVSEGQVRAVALEMVKQAARADLQRVEARTPRVLRRLRRFAKIPPRRGRRR